MELKLTVNGTEYEVEVEVAEETRQAPTIIIGGGGGTNVAAPTTAKMPAASANAVVAPLAGSVARVLVEEGDSFEAGAVLLVLEAMKMETEITAPAAGSVGAILVEPGQAVQGGQALIELKA